MRFETGQVVVTRSIAAIADVNENFKKEINVAFNKYVNCDWGTTCEEDSAMNDEAVNNGERILAAYDTCEGTIWIITEWDRSVTTILFPSDY